MTCPEPELDDGLEVPFRLLPELPELDELELVALTSPRIGAPGTGFFASLGNG